MRFAGVYRLERPATVASTLGEECVQGVRHAPVPRYLGALKIVEGAQNIVLPARRKGELEKLRVDDLAGTIGLVEAVGEDKLPCVGGGAFQLIEAILVPVPGVFENAL